MSLISPCRRTDLQLTHRDTHPLRIPFFLIWKDPESNHAQQHIFRAVLLHAPQILLYPSSSISHEVRRRNLLADKDWLARTGWAASPFSALHSWSRHHPRYHLKYPPPLSELLAERLLGAEVVHRTTPNPRFVSNNINHLRMEVEPISG